MPPNLDVQKRLLHGNNNSRKTARLVRQQEVDFSDMIFGFWFVAVKMAALIIMGGSNLEQYFFLFLGKRNWIDCVVFLLAAPLGISGVADCLLMDFSFMRK